MKSVFLSKGAVVLSLGLAGGVAATGAAAQENNARFYGFFNLIGTSTDDGFQTNTKLVDNSNAPSRIGLWWENPVGAGTLKFNFETAMGLRGSSSLSMTNQDPDFVNYSRTSLRKVDFSWGGDFGTIYAGQGSMAADGMTGADDSGTGYISTSAVADVSGGYTFRMTGSGTPGPTVGAVFSDFDGGRLGRIRYDSPTFGPGFSVGASVGENILVSGNDDINYDLALRFSQDNGAMKYDARLGGLWVDGRNGNADNSAVVGSFSVLNVSTGLNGKIGAGWRDNSGLGSNYVYTKLGVRRDWWQAGETRLSADFFWGNDSVLAGDDGFTWGLQATQVIENANAELYLAYRQHSYDQPGASFEDVGAWAFGGRWFW